MARRFLRLLTTQPVIHHPTLERFAACTTTRKSLNTLVYPDISDTALMLSANYVRQELPIRLAHRLVEMQRLPYFVLTTPSLHQVHTLYQDAFSSCAAFPPITSLDEETTFSNFLAALITDSERVIDAVAKGLQEVRRLSSRRKIYDPTLHAILQRWVEALLTSRIGRRVLAEQHIALHRAVCDGDPGPGVVDPACDVHECVHEAARAAHEISTTRYGVAPHVEITGGEARMPFIRAHLRYVLFELLKNAMRATVEHASGSRLTDVGVFVAKGPEQITIRISDAGGGIRRSERDRVFEYGFTTAGVEEEGFGGMMSTTRDSPMAGLGFGLPISRLYARYFGGETSLVSLEGYGCDVYVTLSRTGDVLENIQV